MEQTIPYNPLMKITSWNINSVRLRLPLIKRLMEESPTDILCLQETKTPDEFFPQEELRALGFTHQAFRGEKGYNGVAILSRVPLAKSHHGDFGGIDQTRHIAATLPNGTELHNFYIPAGGDVPDVTLNPKFAHKLQFVEDLTAWSAARDKTSPCIILGDFNIAPLEHDVWSHKQLLGVVSHTPQEVSRLNAALAVGGWIDTHRHFVPHSEKLYSWWSYRAREWEASDRGRRLDHLWISPSLLPSLKETAIFKAARGWDSPSDHVPISAILAEAA
jgi:exodeoxyribonuclease-3